MIRIITCAVLLLAFESASRPDASQGNSDLETFFRQNIGLSQQEIDDIQNGRPVAKTLPPRSPSEVFLFGAVHIHAAPESYFHYVRDLDRLRRLPNYQALGVLHNPPSPADWKGFSFADDEIQSLRSCKAGDCQIQMPASSIEEVHHSINWSAGDVNDEVNGLLQKTAQQFLLAYQRDGNKALGFYNDKRDSIQVGHQFAYMLSYDTVLPKQLPDFYNYLLAYPNARPVNVDNTFYWARVKFGLKPTLRIVQMITMRGGPEDSVAYAVAEKQLYASHYFETALDLSFCVRGSEDAKQSGFYLIMTMGSEQAGLTGVKGSVVRKTAVGRSLSGLRNALATIKNTLQANP